MSLQVLVEIQTAPCHRPVMLREKGWEKTIASTNVHLASRRVGILACTPIGMPGAG